MSALSLLAKAEGHCARSQWSLAHSCLSRARRAAADPFLHAEILHKDAEALRALGRFEESLASYRSSHALYRKLRVPSERLSTLLGASACLRVLGRYAEARRLWSAVSKTSLLTHPGGIASEVELERALVARGQGRFSETRQRIDLVLRSLLHKKTSSGRATLQHAYWVLGGLERFTGFFPRALQAFAHAVRLARESGDVSAEAFALCGLAGVERVVGRDRASLLHYRAAYRTLKKSGDPFGEAYGLCGQANAHRTFGNPAQSLPLYRRSAALYRRLGDESSEAFAHWGAGGSLRRLKRFPFALASHALALRLFMKSKDHRGVVMAHLGLARCAEDQGQTGAALREAARALSVARREKLHYEADLARYEKGRILHPLRPPYGILKARGISAAVLNRWQDIP
jgi:tetratricopeptide (TPR) repeat protein